MQISGFPRSKEPASQISKLQSGKPALGGRVFFGPPLADACFYMVCLFTLTSGLTGVPARDSSDERMREGRSGGTTHARSLSTRRSLLERRGGELSSATVLKRCRLRVRHSCSDEHVEGRLVDVGGVGLLGAAGKRVGAVASVVGVVGFPGGEPATRRVGGPRGGLGLALLLRGLGPEVLLEVVLRVHLGAQRGGVLVVVASRGRVHAADALSRGVLEIRG